MNAVFMMKNKLILQRGQNDIPNLSLYDVPNLRVQQHKLKTQVPKRHSQFQSNRTNVPGRTSNTTPDANLRNLKK